MFSEPPDLLHPKVLCFPSIGDPICIIRSSAAAEEMWKEHWSPSGQIVLGGGSPSWVGVPWVWWGFPRLGGGPPGWRWRRNSALPVHLHRTPSGALGGVEGLSGWGLRRGRGVAAKSPLDLTL